jgi:enoyl-CoA hydratase/carnithine racemase
MANVRIDHSRYPDSGCCTISIERPEVRNALDRATLDELVAAFDAAARDESVRVIVLRGAGDRAFCAGADLQEVLDHDSIDTSRRHFDGVRRLIEAMHRAPQPVITRVPGFALAGGCGVAVAGDFTIASQSAVFGLPEIAIGLLPLMVSAPLLRAMGSRKALLDLVLTGRRVDADEALRLGLVTRVVPDDALDDTIAGLVETLGGLSPSALRMGKEAVYTLCELEYNAAMRYLREMIVLVSRTQDAQEGVRAFFEKRRPQWTGR